MNIAGAKALQAGGGVGSGNIFRRAAPAGRVEGVDLFEQAAENARRSQALREENKLDVTLNTIQ